MPPRSSHRRSFNKGIREESGAMRSIVALRARLIPRPAPTALFYSTSSTASIPDDVSCVGWDGGPLHRGGGGEGGTGRRYEEASRIEDNRRYYEKHKPSPLSEVEFADTRKPISQATDRVGGGGDDEKAVYSMVKETVDDALRRAEELWWAAKVRGLPDSPQAKALARMLAERNTQ